MVEAGSVVIKVEADTVDMKRGMREVSSGLKSVSKNSKSVFADMSRTGIVVGRLAQAFGALALAGAGTMINLAKGAPATAGAMAEIGIQTERLKRSMGTALQPVFDTFASSYKSFVNWIEGHPDLTRSIFGGSVAVAGATTLIAGISKLAGLTFGATLVAGLGHLAAIATALAPGALAIVIGEGLATYTNPENVLNVPISDAAKSQIENAAGTYEGSDLANRYSINPFSGHAEQTPQTDLETGELYSSKHFARDVVKYAQNVMSISNSNRYNTTMNSADNVFLEVT